MPKLSAMKALRELKKNRLVSIDDEGVFKDGKIHVSAMPGDSDFSIEFIMLQYVARGIFTGCKPEETEQ